LDKWEVIIFSDECSVERGAGATREWVWRTPAQKWDKEMIQPEKTRKDISIMVWGAIWLGGRSDLIVMQRDEESPRGGYSANSYIKVLEEAMPTMFEPGLTFMRDNARIHTAKKVTDWLEDHAIPVLDWPAYSPDLNPIENLWAILKQRLNSEYPELINMGKSQQDLDYFGQCINKIWHSIPDEIIANLIKSMDSRVQCVLDAKGWHTRY
jgi:DDE superfamily endonuclease